MKSSDLSVKEGGRPDLGGKGGGQTWVGRGGGGRHGREMGGATWLGFILFAFPSGLTSRGDEGGGFLCLKAGSTGLLGLVTIDGDGGIHCGGEKKVGVSRR